MFAPFCSKHGIRRLEIFGSIARGTPNHESDVDLLVTFERPAYDAPLTFDAHVQSGGRQIFFVEGVCRDTNGAVCSRAVAIYRRFERRLSAPAESITWPT